MVSTMAAGCDEETSSGIAFLGPPNLTVLWRGWCIRYRHSLLGGFGIQQGRRSLGGESCEWLDRMQMSAALGVLVGKTCCTILHEMMKTAVTEEALRP